MKTTIILLRLFSHIQVQIFIALICVAGATSCQKEVPIDPTDPKPDNSIFSSNIPLGEVQNNMLREVSGIAPSRILPGAIWAHNDRGDGARIYLMKENGTHLGIYQLEGIAARDWEDMVIGPGPIAGTNYIYTADIGDNEEKYKILYIYRFPEPDLRSQNFPTEQVITDVEVIKLVFDGKSRDAETLLIDPNTKDIFIISKREKSSKIYQAAYPQSLTQNNMLQQVGELPFKSAVGGDISGDGREILIKNYDDIYYWEINGQESIAEALAKEPIILPYEKEPQGEAIGWKPDGTGFYTLSEQVNNITPVLYHYRRT